MGKIFSFLNVVFNFIQLSALWVVFSIPIITAGAATTALYYTANKCLKNKRSYIWTEFWGSFKENFRQSTFVWIIYLLITVLFLADIWILKEITTKGSFLSNFYIIFIVLFVIMTVYILWVLIYISRFEDKSKMVFKNCIILFFKHFSISLLILLVLVFATFLIWFLPFFLFLAPSYAAYLLVVQMEKVFIIYMKEEDIKKEEELNKREGN